MNQPNHNIELIPVIEVEPYSFAKSEYDSPQVTILNDPMAWEIYNQKSYLDSGLTHMVAVKPGYWLFEANCLTVDQLYIIYQNHFNRFFETPEAIAEMLSDMREYAPLIAGGFMVRVNGEIVSLPGCCSGLECIEDWQNILKEPEDKTGEIWNGHDVEHHVRFSRLSTGITLSIDNALGAYYFPDQQYQALMDTTIAKLQTFISTLGSALNQVLQIENGEELARVMIFRK